MSENMLPLPPTDAIKDPQVRTALDAIVQNLNVVRGEYVNTGNVQSYTQEALVNILSGGTARDGASIDNIWRAVLSSELYRKLTEPFSVALDNSKAVVELQNRVSAALGAQQETAKQLTAEAQIRADAITAEANLRVAETNARIAAMSAEATARTAAIQNEADTRATAILNEASARATAIGALQTQINTLQAASSGDFSQLLAAVQTEQTARIAADSAEATSRETLATQLRGAYSGTDPSMLTTGILYTERQARITAEGSISSSVSALSSTVSNNYTSLNSAITTEATTRASADSTLTTNLATLTSTVNANNTTLTSSIQQEATTRADAISAEATLRQQLAARVGTAESNISSLQTTTATQATSLTSLTTRVGSAESNITGLQNTTASQATTLASLTTRMGTAESSITSLNTTTAGQATSINTLTTSVGQKARVFAQTTAPASGGSYTLAANDIWYDTGNGNKPYRWSGTAWVDATDTRLTDAGSNITSLQSTTASQAASLTSLSTRMGSAESSITSLNTTTSSQASSLSSLTTRVGNAESSISSLNTTTAGQATSINSLTSRMGSAESAITSETTARTNADTAQTNSINALVSRMGSAESAITTEQSTRSTKDNAIAAAVNNIWAKMNGSGSAIDDGALAAVSPSAATATRWSSVIAAVTDPNTGQINTSSIKQELNTYASNANNTFNSSYTLRINNNGYITGFGLQTTSGAGTAGGGTSNFVIMADSFSLVTPGQNPVVPFTVSAGKAVFTGDLYAAGGTFAGNLSAAGGTFSGSLSAVGGTFTGSLSAASGTFSGSLTASAVNAVNTINLAGQAVTIPVSYKNTNMVGVSSGAYTTIIPDFTMDAGGQPIWLCLTGLAGYFSGGHGDFAASAEIVVDGVVVAASGTGYGSVSAGGGPFAISALISGGATRTIGVRATCVLISGYGPGASYMYPTTTLFAIGVKR